jgi:hypothetical protein
MSRNFTPFAQCAPNKYEQLVICSNCSGRILYHFDRKFTNSENLRAEMADKFSFVF